MKIHKRFPPTLSRPLAAVTSTSAAGPSTTSRVRSNSGCSTRSLYTASSSSSSSLPFPFPFADAPPPSSSPPSARPGSTNLVISTRLAAEVKAELESGQTSHHGQQQDSPHTHAHNTNSSSGPPPYSLVFSSGNTLPTVGSSTGQAHYQLLFPNHLPFGSTPVLESAHGPGATKGEEEQRLARDGRRYQLDVGAYGIPKYARSRRGGRVAGRDGLTTGTTPAAHRDHDNEGSRAVQVGEDAYFIRDNAMGVADGVGGWAKARSRSEHDEDGPTPSALFAKRLMHYCCEEVEVALDPYDISADLREQLDDSLEELADGLDVLNILEKAYEKTMKAHVVVPAGPISQEGSENADHTDVVHASAAETEKQIHGNDNGPARASPAGPSSISDLNIPYLETAVPRSSSAETSPSSHPCSSQQPSDSSPEGQSSESSASRAVPLMQGSSTALLAVLEQRPNRSIPSSPGSLTGSPGVYPQALSTAPASSRSSSHDWYPLGNPKTAAHIAKPSIAQLFNPQARRLFEQATGVDLYGRDRWGVGEAFRQNNVQPQVSEKPAAAGELQAEGGAVLRIAHLGDCMGMVVRGEEVVWRTEEMWWGFNTPVQLGPASPTRPADARTFCVPVQADDIVILASDGLSDNLWEEDILDEVGRFRKGFMEARTNTGQENAVPSPSTTKGILGRGALAAMLSEALCSRARRVSERRPSTTGARRRGRGDVTGKVDAGERKLGEEDDIPFGRRAREEGRWFAGGKLDDISVLVAVVSPVEISTL
ncbi:hypothetical protein BDW22DRAFT_1363302 [Trametopsis cervina]|nr:hypothetical protein BDW22DRAFT_1363302 [Trametopsis cervina]